MIKEYFYLSYDSLRHRGLRSWLTIIGIFIGITAIVSLISLGEGLRTAVSSQFGFLSTDILVVQASGLNFGPPGVGAVNPLKEEDASGLSKLNGVDTAVGRIIESAIIEFNEKSDASFVASVPNGDNRKTVERMAQLESHQGRLLKDSDNDKAVVGINYAKPDRFGKSVETGSKIKINGKDFEVIGILKKKGSFTVDNAVLMNEEEVKRIFDIRDRYNVIAVKVSKGSDMSAVKERVEEYLRKERNVKKGGEDFSVQSPQQAIETLDSVLFAIQIFVYLIAGISIVVGGIGISNTMYTSVIERTREIGIMKAIGARNSDIFSLFLVESGLLGTVGGVIGVAVGLAIANGLAFIGVTALDTELIRVNASMPLILGALAFSFLVGSISGLLPAMQASKLKPVEALRYVK